MLIKGNVLPDEQNKMETSGWMSDEYRINRLKIYYFLINFSFYLRMCIFCSTFAVAFSEGKQVRFLHSPAAVIRNPMFIILKVTGWNSWRSKVEGQLYAGKAEHEER